jgi:colanic acid biosynthesis glycosyl transferase WcaI
MGAPAARVAELARLWTEAGHHVTVLTGFPNHPTGIVPCEYRSKIWRLVYREQLNGIEVIRTWLLPFPNRKPYERILNYSSFCVSAATTGLFLSRPDVVIATSPQLLVGLAGWWLTRWKRVPFILEVRDLWPESLAAVEMGNENSLMYRILEKIAAHLYRACNQIVVVTPAFKDLLVANWRVPSGKIFVIENGVDTDLFKPRTEAAEMRAAMQAQNKVVVSYIGTMGLAHGLETLLEAASQLRDSAPQILFLLLGEGAEKERIISAARHRGLTNIQFIAQQPRDAIPAYISASDVCVVPLRKCALFGTVLPTKLLEFMSCARPVIVGVHGLARTIVQDANAGIFVEPENSADLVNAISRLAGNPELCKTLGRNGRLYILQKFTRRQTAEAYMRVLTTLIDGQQMHEAAAAA